MTHCFKPTCYNNRAKQNHWINNVHLTHDLICFCDQPTRHLILAITEKEEPIIVTREEKAKILKCLTTTEETTTATTDGDQNIDEIGLDALFAEKFEEEDTEG